jgi:hypothetical protein
MTGSVNTISTTPLNGDAQQGGVEYECFSSNGQFVGAVTDPTNTFYIGVYGATPASTATKLVAPSGEPAYIGAAVNEAGNIAGWSDGDFLPFYWASSTSTPVGMPLPAKATEMIPKFISDAKMIIGTVFNGTSATPTYVWPTPTSQPVELSTTNSFIGASRGGAILLKSGSSFVVMPSYTGAAITLTAVDGKAPAQASMGADGTVGGQAQSGVACYWLSTNYSKALPLSMPAGSKSAFPSSLNDSRAACGTYTDSSGTVHACYWPTLASAPIDLSTGTSLSGAQLYSEQILDNDEMIVSGTASNSAAFTYLVTVTNKAARRTSVPR